MKDWARYAIFTALGVFNLLYSGRLLSGKTGGVAGWLSLAIGLALVGSGLYLLARELLGKGRGGTPG